jgi:hypothetical protein
MFLGRWPGSLGQGLYDCIQLSRTEVLENASSAYSGPVAVGLRQGSGVSYKVKQGVNSDIVESDESLLKVDGGAGGFMLPNLEEGSSQPLLSSS